MTKRAFSAFAKVTACILLPISIYWCWMFAIWDDEKTYQLPSREAVLNVHCIDDAKRVLVGQANELRIVDLDSRTDTQLYVDDSIPDPLSLKDSLICVRSSGSRDDLLCFFGTNVFEVPLTANRHRLRFHGHVDGGRPLMTLSLKPGYLLLVLASEDATKLRFIEVANALDAALATRVIGEFQCEEEIVAIERHPSEASTILFVTKRRIGRMYIEHVAETRVAITNDTLFELPESYSGIDGAHCSGVRLNGTGEFAVLIESSWSGSWVQIRDLHSLAILREFETQIFDGHFVDGPCNSIAIVGESGANDWAVGAWNWQNGRPLMRRVVSMQIHDAEICPDCSTIILGCADGKILRIRLP